MNDPKTASPSSQHKKDGPAAASSGKSHQSESYPTASGMASSTSRSFASESSTSASSASASSGSDNLGQSARSQIDSVREASANLSEKAQEQASGLAGSLKDKARDLAEQQKARGSEQIDGVAKAIRDVADELDKQMPAAAGYVRQAAGGVEQFSSSLRNRSVEDLMDSAMQFARRQPVVFFGASVLAGFTLLRFLKSSSQAPTRSMGQSYGSPAATGHAMQGGMSGHTPASSHIGTGSYSTPTMTRSSPNPASQPSSASNYKPQSSGAL